MSYNTHNVERIRSALRDKLVVEKHMFGSLGFMVNGKLAVCVKEMQCMYKVDQHVYDEAIAHGECVPMMHGGRLMKGWVFVDNDRLADQDTFDRWLRHALSYNNAMTETT